MLFSYLVIAIPNIQGKNFTFTTDGSDEILDL
jgi:hypothetical protein